MSTLSNKEVNNSYWRLKRGLFIRENPNSIYILVCKAKKKIASFSSEDQIWSKQASERGRKEGREEGLPPKFSYTKRKTVKNFFFLSSILTPMNLTTNKKSKMPSKKELMKPKQPRIGCLWSNVLRKLHQFHSHRLLRKTTRMILRSWRT